MTRTWNPCIAKGPRRRYHRHVPRRTASSELACRIDAVDEAISIVIDTVVTHLGTRTCRISAAVGVGAVDQEVAVVVDPVRAVLRCTEAQRTESTVGIRTVDEQVSVVVHAVAAVLGGQNAEGACGTVGVRAVRQPIAVVVQPVVADLQRRALEWIANLGDTAHAVLLDVQTDPETAGRRPESLVRRPVAVVVESVADFDLREGGLGADDRSPGAVGSPVVAATGQAGRTRDAAAGITFVNTPVAVIVLPVADLGRREDRLNARTGSARTAVRACGADTREPRETRGPRVDCGFGRLTVARRACGRQGIVTDHPTIPVSV